ncbi:MAG: cell division protein ZapA [bacterium]
MPELEITIGGRSFFVSCRSGEEHFLNAAAKMLDTEAQPILQSMGRLPEPRMLLMAGLMLADRTAAVEDEVRSLKAKVAEMEGRTTPEREKIEVPVVPQEVTDTLAELAARAESLADQIEGARA